MNGIHPDCQVWAVNLTDAALDDLPKRIALARKHGRLEEAHEDELLLQRVDLESATETGVGITILSNSHDSFRAVRERVAELLLLSGAQQAAAEFFHQDKQVSFLSKATKFDPRKPMELNCITCVKKLRRPKKLLT